MISNVKMKLLSFLITMAFIGPSVSVPAFAIVNAGATCKTEGQVKTASGLRFLCVKFAGKLVWSQGSRVTKPKSTSKPIAVPRKYPSWQPPISKLEISRASRENFKSWLTSQSAGIENIGISINPEIDTRKVQYITSTVKLTSRTLLQNQKPSPRMYISIGDSWAITEMKKDFPDLAGWSGSNVCYVPNPYAACAWPNFGIIFIISKSSAEWNSTNQGVLQSVAHEYFHLVQDMLLRNSLGLDSGEIARKIPSWFFEGSAQFIGTAYADVSGLALWNEIRNNEIQAYATGRGTNEPLSSFRENLVDRPQPEGQSLRPYGIGMLASEFIVASVGMERFLDVFSKLSSGMPFNEAFTAATGLGLEEFYSKFDSMRSQIGFFPVKNRK